MTDGFARGIPVRHVAVEAEALRVRLDALRARGLSPEQTVVADGVEQFLRSACQTASRVVPAGRRLGAWWRGSLAEEAYANLHAARVQMIDLISEEELDAEIPGVLARTRRAIRADDPRRMTAAGLAALTPTARRARVRHLLRDGYAAGDSGHAQLRNFRNILVMAAFTVAGLVVLTCAVARLDAGNIPLCFPRQVPVATPVSLPLTGPDAGEPAETTMTDIANLNCPTGGNVLGPQEWDVAVVALFGLLGGALTAAVSLRKLHNAATAYDVPVALAMLKVPLGALTAIVGLIAIRGGFIPGLSVLDSQQQILAYALFLGFAQQVLTRVLDQRASSLIDDLPDKRSMAPVRPDAGGTRVEPPPPPAQPGQIDLNPERSPTRSGTPG